MNQQRLNVNLGFRPAETPATTGLLAAIFVLFVLINLTEGLTSSLLHWLMFVPTGWYHAPWTLVTGSLLAGGVGMGGGGLWLLCAMAMVFWIAGSLERSLGTRSLLALWCGASALIALSQWVSTALTGSGGTIDPLVVLYALFVPWAVLNRFAVIRFWCVLPMSAWVFAALGVIFTLIEYHLPAGLFALVGCLYCWGFMELRSRRRLNPQGRRNNVVDLGRARTRRLNEDSPLDTIRSRQNRDRFEKLIRDSGLDEEPPVH